MFKSLTQNLTNIFDRLKRSGVLTEKQIHEAMRDIRIALLESDVSLAVIKELIAKISERALGQEIIRSISPGQMIVKIVHDVLIEVLSSPQDIQELNFKSNSPVNILFIGLQGSGKTTASAKLALKLKSKGKKILLVSLDTHRPAAQKQLEILAKSIKVDSLEIIDGENPLTIAKRAINFAKYVGFDIVIYDTAGRLHIDDNLMSELNQIKSLISPVEVLIVIDSLIGQDAAKIALKFKEQIGITGIILSRIDSDGRGGAALSVKHITNVPIKFLSSGEKLDSLENFDANRIASRILDMGDIISLVEKAASMIDKQEAEKLAAKMKKGNFDLTDYMNQIKSVSKLGGIDNIMQMIPGLSKYSNAISQNNINEKLFIHQEAIILSMTKKERKNPDILNGTRRKRIALGAGTSIQQVNILIKQYVQVKDMMKKASRLNPKNLLSGKLGKFFS